MQMVNSGNPAIYMFGVEFGGLGLLFGAYRSALLQTPDDCMRSATFVPLAASNDGGCLRVTSLLLSRHSVPNSRFLNSINHNQTAQARQSAISPGHVLAGRAQLSDSGVDLGEMQWHRIDISSSSLVCRLLCRKRCVAVANFKIMTAI